MILDFADIVVLAGLVLASITDIRSQKIYNWLTLPMVVAGIAWHGSQSQVAVALFGLAVAAVIHFPLWVFKVQKGGDAKLMMAIGALYGWSTMVESTFWMFILLIPVGLIALALRGRIGNLLKVFRSWGRDTAGSDEEEVETTDLPFGPVIACAVVAARFTEWLHVW